MCGTTVRAEIWLVGLVCSPEASALRAFGFGLEAPALFQHRRGYPRLIAYFSAHRRASKLPVQFRHRAFAVVVDALPQITRAPTTLNPTSKFGDELLFGFDHRQPIFALDQKQRGEIRRAHLFDLPRDRKSV